MASDIDNPPPTPEGVPNAPIPRRRFKLVIAYDGSDFHGWQKQEPQGVAPLRTVQGEIESALRRLLGEPVILVGSSRTDAGVHARGQVAQFDAVCRIPVERLAEALTGRLPPDIDILSVEVAPDDFDCIQQVRSKRYCYRIHNSTCRPLDRRRYVFHGWVALDESRMDDAARRLVGTHDFAGFAAAGHGRLTTVRTIHDCHVQRFGDELVITVEGSGFLYNMVRIIVGTLFEIGRGHFEPSLIDRILQERNRQLAGPTFPPQGLWLEWIKY